MLSLVAGFPFVAGLVFMDKACFLRASSWPIVSWIRLWKSGQRGPLGLPWDCHTGSDPERAPGCGRVICLGKWGRKSGEKRGQSGCRDAGAIRTQLSEVSEIPAQPSFVVIAVPSRLATAGQHGSPW